MVVGVFFLFIFDVMRFSYVDDMELDLGLDFCFFVY